MLVRKRVERQQFRAIFCQAVCRLRVFRLEGVQKQVEGTICFGSRRSIPDSVQQTLALGLQTLRQFLQNVRRLVNRAALLLRVRPDLSDSGLEAEGSVADRQFWRLRQAA